MLKIVPIPSRLYRAIFEKGGDRLVATFCILKSSRQGKAKFHSFKSKNQKIVSGYGLLRKHSNMSLKALNEHFPKLIELGLAGFEVNGDVWIIGNEASKNIYGRKLVPVAVDSNIIKTAYNSMMVRVHSNYHQQSRQIVKKQFRSDLLKQIDNPESNKQFRQAKRVQNKFGNEIDLNPDIVLSNIGYANIKVHGAQILTKSKGSYWKRKLRKLNFVSTRRRFKLIAECSYSDYLFAKQNNSISKNHIYCNGFLYKELISSLSLTV